MLPLLVAAAKFVVCVHVPGHYVSSGLEPRYAFLRELQRQGRLAVLFGMPRGPMGWRCAWLVVFRSAALKARLLRPGWCDADGIVFSVPPAMRLGGRRPAVDRQPAADEREPPASPAAARS